MANEGRFVKQRSPSAWSRSVGNRGIRRLFYLRAAVEVAAIESSGHLTGSALSASPTTHRPEEGAGPPAASKERGPLR